MKRILIVLLIGLLLVGCVSSSPTISNQDALRIAAMYCANNDISCTLVETIELGHNWIVRGMSVYKSFESRVEFAVDRFSGKLHCAGSDGDCS